MCHPRPPISSVPDQNAGQNSEAALPVSKVVEFGFRDETLRVQAQFGSSYTQGTVATLLTFSVTQDLRPPLYQWKEEKGRQGRDHRPLL